MTTTTRDVISGAVFGALAIGIFAYASSFPVREGQAAAVSPGFYPRLVASLLLLLSLIQIVTAGIKNRRSQRNGEGSNEAVEPLWKDRNALVLVIITLGSLVAYPFVMRLAGFAITGFLFLGLLIFVLSPPPRGGKRLILIFGITMGITVLTFFIFRLFLRIPFPTGLIRL